MTARPIFRYAGWSMLTIVAGMALWSLTHVLLVSPRSRPVAFLEIYHWQLSAWMIWLVLGPAVFMLMKPLTRRDAHDWRMWVSGVAISAGAIVAHALWFGLLSTVTSPFWGLQQFFAAVRFHMQLGISVDFAVIAAIAFIASRATVAESLARHRVESIRALSESEEKFRSLFDNAAVDVFRSTPDGRFLMLNKSAAQTIGYDTPEEAIRAINDIGKEIYVDPDARERFLELVRRDGVITNWISKMRRRDGTVRWQNESARGVFDDHGDLVYVEGTARDVTAEMEAREALQASERHQAELRAQLADAQLRALKLQMKPHFLFNVLNTVAMMIRTGETQKAQEVVTLLGSMFRRFLEFEGTDMVTLEQELAFVDLYLGLERFRFEDRLRIQRDLEPAAMQLPVPTLILQPLVENAVKHGLSEISGICELYVGAHIEQGALEIEIANDVNPDAVKKPGHGYGIGVRNTRARLKELYGDRASFEFLSEATKVRAVLRLPLEKGNG